MKTTTTEPAIKNVMPTFYTKFMAPLNEANQAKSAKAQKRVNDLHLLRLREVREVLNTSDEGWTDYIVKDDDDRPDVRVYWDGVRFTVRITAPAHAAVPTNWYKDIDITFSQCNRSWTGERDKMFMPEVDMSGLPYGCIGSRPTMADVEVYDQYSAILLAVAHFNDRVTNGGTLKSDVMNVYDPAQILENIGTCNNVIAKIVRVLIAVSSDVFEADEELLDAQRAAADSAKWVKFCEALIKYADAIGFAWQDVKPTMVSKPDLERMGLSGTVPAMRKQYAEKHAALRAMENQ